MRCCGVVHDAKARSSNEIKATAPKGSGSVDVTATTPAGTATTSSADRFTYHQAVPVVTKISPDRGPSDGGTVVTIKGKNLEGVTAVHFGTKLAKIDNDTSASEIKVTVPKGSGSVYVTTTTPGARR